MMMKKAIVTITSCLLSLVLMISLSLCQNLTENEGGKTGSISGHVFSKIEENPIGDIFIDLSHKGTDGDNKYTKTDKAGSYEFEGLMPGIYLVHIGPLVLEGEIYPPQYTNDIVVNPGQCIKDINIYIQLKPLTSITGKVINKESSEPIRKANVTVYRKENNKWERAASDHSNAEGDYKIKGIEGGEYQIKAKAEGYSPEIKDNIKVNKNAKIDGVNFALSLAAAEITGKVTDIEGVGVQGIEVELYSKDASYIYETKTDLKGDYFLKCIADNSYYMLLFKDDAPAGYKKIKIDGAGIKEVNFEIK
jgi:protocatechuate 3,4-dioxygenase beta subunit